MANAVFSVFKKYDLNIDYLRGQSYDNASNMSGIYAGLQAKIKNVNPLAKFVPCSAHSLNLVGTNAVDCSLDLIKNDDAEKTLSRNEARGILNKLNNLETAFLSIFWGQILHRFNLTSKKLQSVNIDLSVVCEFTIKQFQSFTKRSKSRKQFFDEGPSKESTVEYSDFRNAEILQNKYKDDLSPLFANECVHFRSHLLSIGDKAPKTIQGMCSFLRKNDLIGMYPYIDVSLRMLLCTPVSNCSTERSFSCLKRIKTYLWSSTSGERLNYLAIMNIEADITTNIQFDDVIQEFATQQSRRKI
ncbi:uncharacterized protein LOC107884322 [Acyrthosiphon pisum]|uniref:HAT C-terminal dimerisation domain-containing protein n=1 Tax=Acyrthosiphon pisum TaxID=7029 RepID=A0A8R2D4W2_ACYPI|nr:uncharacterized protein LOC107884322 [Acyrthosiphon pisum]|eukprot:XP_016661623.1 PREDICTED: uncharacterized protein LOC107884322 [Acyrthosiphon pisum]